MRFSSEFTREQYAKIEGDFCSENIQGSSTIETGANQKFITKENPNRKMTLKLVPTPGRREGIFIRVRSFEA